MYPLSVDSPTIFELPKIDQLYWTSKPSVMSLELLRSKEVAAIFGIIEHEFQTLVSFKCSNFSKNSNLEYPFLEY